ncbi:phosphomannomutase [Natrialbaceae archaeon AArc-T1-2]|uniref:phosphomannomutase n=1 Tax=Natrialbaceae archaeon AArc-T1-2 TaxID=3053904 RepID=UPI00255AE61A|nr:phosphomannomutase [Natrialbaceae archaeon AArc-T1-2]WIV68259.1 phosphomannomutase [Natrialbaceae archaeon AArc-T1-2]
MTRFGTAGIRGPVESEVTPELAVAVGRAAGEPGETVVVGRDGRETGPALAAALEAGLASAGADVRRLGVVPTPALAFASRGRRGVMVTASHNPPADNGLKLFVDGVEYDRDAEATIDARIEDEPGPAPWDEWGSSERVDVLEPYREAVTAYVRDRFGDEPLARLSVVVDCGAGVGGLATPQVLDRLGADVVALNAAVDGHFPARESKPTPETLSDLSAFLAEGSFDLGLAHDGDADRLVVLDGNGDVVHEDTVLAVVAADYVRRSEAADPVVVTTPNASARIDEQVRAAGGRTERVRLGALHEGIARERREGGDGTAVVFAAEPWKHVHPAFGGWIDGVASAAVVACLVADADSVDALRAPVSERPYRKRSVDCADEAKSAVMDRLETALPEEFPDATVETAYGVRLEFDDASWTLVRPSGTEPYVRIYAESDDVAALVADVREVVERAIADAV